MAYGLQSLIPMLARLRSFSIPLILITLFVIPADAATRLTYPIHGKTTAVVWPESAFPLGYHVDQKMINAMPDAAAAVERAFTTWSLPETQLAFKQLPVITDAPPRRARDGRNVVSIAADLYNDDGFIALTTNWYQDDGTLYESDIEVDPSLLRGGYNVQQTLAHEIGHLLGLDHSAVLSSVMYPWVGRGTGAFSLDSDDRIGMTTLYAKAGFDQTLTSGTLQGRVVGDQGGIFAAQVVAVNELGQPVATALTDAQGEYELRGIPPGDYRLYAEPLDGPVDIRNLAGIWRQAKVTSFKTQFYADAPMRVDVGRVYGNLVVSSASDIQLNPRWIGVSDSDSMDFSLTTTPVNVKPGARFSLAVAGDGFTSGMTEFEVLSPGFRRVSDFRYAANFVSATYELAPGTPGGSAVILVRSGNETATLTGALQIQATPRTRSVRR